MSYLETALRLILRLSKHPASQAVGKYALRQATAELVRQVRKRTRAGVKVTHIS